MNAENPIHLIELESDGTVAAVRCERAPDTWIHSPGIEVLYRESRKNHRLTGEHRASCGPTEGGTRCIYRGPEELVLVVEWSLDPEVGAVIVRSRLKNEGGNTLVLDSLSPLVVSDQSGGGLSVGGSLQDCTFLKNGWQSWGATENLRVSGRDFSPYLNMLRVMQENPENRATGGRGEFVSEMFTCLVNLKSGEALGLGFVTAADLFSDVRLVAGEGGRILLETRCHLDGIPLAPGAEVSGEDLYLRIGRRADDLPRRYAQYLGQRMKARIPESNPTGWCSWYYYYTGVSEQAVLSNLDALDRMREQIPVDYVQIDDGYTTRIGDWLSINEKFPSGMAHVAQRISERGYTPGIWTAPFIARSNARLFREHPDWFMKNERGKPVFAGINPLWKGAYYGLDLTHPEVEDWLREVFTTLHDAWGYRFFKIDFLYAAALAGRRRDGTVTRAQALRRGLAIIRECIGDSFLLGCGCPLGPAIGIVDAMRIGPDVAPVWGSKLMRTVLRDKNSLGTVNAIRNTINRYFMHRTLWQNDPDCLLVREDRSRLTLDEVRSLATVIALSGGMVLLSDDLPRLSPERIDIAREVLRLSGEGLTPVDYCESPYPSVLLCERPGGFLLGVLNYDRKSADRSLDLGAILGAERAARIDSIQEVWTRSALDHQDGRLALKGIPPHGCVLARILLRQQD